MRLADWKTWAHILIDGRAAVPCGTECLAGHDLVAGDFDELFR
jgi:hypothetical protein